MKLLKEAKYKEKKSKFFAYLYEVGSEVEAESVIKSLKVDNRKANHVCWASIVDGQELFKNDGEVGRPANTMLEIMKHKKMDQRLVAVVRYFGGVKLGSGGVKRAFKEAMLQCIS